MIRRRRRRRRRRRFSYALEARLLGARWRPSPLGRVSPRLGVGTVHEVDPHRVGHLRVGVAAGARLVVRSMWGVVSGERGVVSGEWGVVSSEW